jgi:hypothetical protein
MSILEKGVSMFLVPYFRVAIGDTHFVVPYKAPFYALDLHQALFAVLK